MNCMFFQRKNNKLIHIQKHICTILILKQLSRLLVPRGSTLLPSKDLIHLFLISTCAHLQS
jgi:hypothetical protein